jgi:translation initiation factor IF-3
LPGILRRDSQRKREREVRGTDRQYRVNERIRVPQVRLIDENGIQVGIVPTRQAISMAQERGLDLIEVAPTAKPPVCRIMDYGKYRYQQDKRDREARKKRKQSELRSVRLRPMIDNHDLDVKLKLVKRLLEDGDKVRVNLIFRARELPHPELGRKVLQKLAEGVTELAQVERGPSLEGRMMSMILSPK